MKSTGKVCAFESYNKLLKKNPLLIKVLTGSVISGLNEVISSSITKKDKVEILVQKVLLMMFYGGAINTTINHYGYNFLIKFVSRLSKLLKTKSKTLTNTVQLFGSLAIISPVQVCFLIATLTTVNSPIINRTGSILDLISFIRKDFKAYISEIKKSINDKFPKFYTSSFISSCVFLSIAQNFIDPEKWTIFFSTAYGLLNTGQNIYLKLKQDDELKKDQDDQ